MEGGPIENYEDRNSGAHIGIYNSSVKDMSYSYVRPQENGNRMDTRWLNLGP